MRPQRPAVGWTPAGCAALAVVCLLALLLLAACGLKPDVRDQLEQRERRPLQPAPAATLEAAR